MKYIFEKNKIAVLLVAGCMMLFGACNKGLNEIPEPQPVEPTGQTLGETIKSNDNDSLYYRLIVRSGLLSTIDNKAANFTMFVTDNNGMKLFINAASGGMVPIGAPNEVFSSFITTNIPVSNAQAIVAYNTIPQKVPFEAVPALFPNFQYPSIFNPAPTLSSLLRLTTFPSSANGKWLNNMPVTTTDVEAYNGVIHHTFSVVTPPSRYVWDRINTDPNLSIFKAAVERADSGLVASAGLRGGLSNIGANFTVLAPSNQAMKNAISFLSQGMLQPTDPDINFIGFLGSNFVTTQIVKGIVVYHMFDGFSNTASPGLSVPRPGRFFLNNMPVTATAYPTLLSSANTTGFSYPPVTLQATFGPTGVTAATVKGFINPTASNILINPTPDPGGTSDQHFLNGTLHVIDQVLLPSM